MKLTINTDSIYVKGHNHAVCEDYAYAGEVLSKEGDVHYAVICDGCSSAKDSDVGARLLAHGLVKFLRNMGNLVNYFYREPEGFYEQLDYQMMRTVHNSAENVGLSKFSFIATIQAIIVIKDKLFYYRYGDGSMFDYCNGDIHRPFFTEFTSRTPYYFVDSFMGRDMECYCKNYKDDKIILDGHGITPDNYVYDWTNFWKVIDLNHLQDGNNVFAVTSDGIETFYEFDDLGKQVSPEFEWLYRKAFNFKNFQGSFIKRRFNKFFKDMVADGFYHYDDISVAAIHIKKESE